MRNQNHDTVKCIKNQFKLNKEFRIANCFYVMIMCALNDKNISKTINEMERLIEQKNNYEIILAYQKGLNTNCTENELFLNGVDETIKLSLLYDDENYFALIKKLSDLRNHLRDENKNNLAILLNLENLFELYDNINYELIKTAFLFGYQKNH